MGGITCCRKMVRVLLVSSTLRQQRLGVVRPLARKAISVGLALVSNHREGFSLS
jgi:hypothetical protein